MASFIFLFNYCIYVMLCEICYHFYNLKNVENTHGKVLLLLKLQAFAKSNPPPWVFFTILKLYKWYKAAPLFVLQSDTPIYRVLIVQHLLFFHWRHQRAATRLENVHRLNIRRGKNLGFQLSHRPRTFNEKELLLFVPLYPLKQGL